MHITTINSARKFPRANDPLLWFWYKYAELKTSPIYCSLDSVAIADDFYHISYLWFSALSVLTSFIVGILVSFAFGEYAKSHLMELPNISIYGDAISLCILNGAILE